MIEYRQSGSIFDSGCEALVVPVNCEGVAGRGLALEFKRRFRGWFGYYRDACLVEPPRLLPGCVLSYSTGVLFPSCIVSFPTKRNWRDISQLSNIRDGLEDLAALLRRSPWITSLALPALGCGLGGLDWAEVKPLVERHLGGLACRVVVYEPQEPAP